MLTRLKAYSDQRPAPKAARMPRRNAKDPASLASAVILSGSTEIAAAPLMATSVARSQRERLATSCKPSWNASTMIGMNVSAASRLDACSSRFSLIAAPVRDRTAPRCAVPLDSLAQGSEAFAKVVNDRLRLLPRRKMSAVGVLLVIEQLRIGCVRPFPRDRADFLGKRA